MYGRCGVFGYAVEDKDTLPSFVQKYLNDKRESYYRVNNYGLWGAGEVDLLENILVSPCASNDIIVFYVKFLPIVEERIKNTTWRFYDAAIWIRENIRNLNFFEIIGHMNRDGYNMLGKKISDILLNDTQDVSLKEENVFYHNTTSELEIEHDSFIQHLKELKIENASTKKIGAIVMNCNPFTLGHKYLVETAAKKVDNLYIFVVQEDRSEISFHDRFFMVKEGVKDLDNVVVTESGQLILSSLTFPEYFEKENKQDVIVDSTKDIDIFARIIAPLLNIQIRFVGEEPRDLVTRQYNEKMRQILPRYGIQVEIIKRLKYGGDVISASIVRKKWREKDLNGLKNLIPDTTFHYMMNHLK